MEISVYKRSYNPIDFIAYLYVFTTREIDAWVTSDARSPYYHLYNCKKIS